MQTENYLNKDKVQAMLDTRPDGVSIPDALKALSTQGFTIEGYNDESLAKKAGKQILGFAQELAKAPGGLGEAALGAVSENVLQPVGEKIGGFLGGQLKGTRLGESLKANAPGITQVTEAITTPQYETPKSAKEAAGMGLQTASYILPYGRIAEGVVGLTGSRLAGQLGAGATGGYATDVAQNLQEDVQGANILTPGIGTVAGLALPAGFAGAQGLGRGLQKVGVSTAEAVLPRNIQEAGIVQAYKAEKPFFTRISEILTGTEKAPQTLGKTAVETTAGQTIPGLFGSKAQMGVQAKRAQDTLWKGFLQPQLDNAGVQIDLPKYFDTVAEKIVAETPELTRQKALLEALNSFKDDYAGINTVSLARLQKLKEGWAEFVPEKFYKGQNIAGNARQVSALLADEARQTIYNTLGQDAKKAYFDYGNLMGLAELGKSEMTGQKLKGGTGGFISDLLGRAVTPIGTFGGQVVYRVGKGIEMIGNAGAKTLDEVLGLNRSQDLIAPKMTASNQNPTNPSNIVNNISETIPQKVKGASKPVEKSKTNKK